MLQIFQALNLQCASSLSSSPSSPPARRCRLAAAVSTCTRKCFLCLLTRVEWVARRRRSRRMTWVFSLVRPSSVGRLAGGATRKRNRRSSAVAPGLQCRGEFFTLGVASLDVSLRKWFLKREMAGGGVRSGGPHDKKETGDGDKSYHCQQVDCRRRSSSPPPSLPPPPPRAVFCIVYSRRCAHAAFAPL